ncbi:MAG: type II secretion system F family protein [Alphaproteobacteria bacterium]|nr:type II secretion system F family protein [Alphaproteobacteria bacterium]
MPLYRYQAVAASGDMVMGELEAATRDGVIELLHGQGHVPIRADLAGSVSWWRLTLPNWGDRSKPKAAKLPLLTHQLSILLQAGLPLDRALEIGQRMFGGAERGTLRELLDAVRGGRSLADAMAAQKALFPPFYVGMIRAAEAGGSLETTLRHLAEYLERRAAAREQVKSALVYPVLVLTMGCLSIGALFGFVIPSFRPLFVDSGKPLPASTELILAVSDGFLATWWIIIVAIVALVLLARAQLRRKLVREWCDRRLLTVPVIGDLLAKTESARISRTLGTLLKNGVAPLAALTITHETVGNLALRAGFVAVIDSVKEGKGLADPLARTKLFPQLVVDLVRVGEETARLDDMLLKIAEIYDADTQRTVARLLALLVPAVTVGLGLIVALVVGSILTTILSVYDLAA